MELKLENGEASGMEEKQWWSGTRSMDDRTNAAGMGKYNPLAYIQENVSEDL